MSHKVSPVAYRIGYTKSWKSNGYSSRKDYSHFISHDVLIRNKVEMFLHGVPVGNILINHVPGKSDEIKIIIYTAKVSLVIWKNGSNIDTMVQMLAKKFWKKITFDVKEIKKPELNAQVVAFSVARQIEKRMPYRRVIKQILQKGIEKGAKGIKIIISGRLGGAEIARSELYKDGNIPAQTIRADIDYATERAETMYGTIGLKIWIYKGNVYEQTQK